MECTLYLTENCNLRCSYCYEGPNKKNSKLSITKLHKTLDFIIKNNPENERIDLTFLGGEPLLNKTLIYETISIIENEYSEFKSNFNFYITTNGILLDKKIIELFIKYDFTVSISIDGDKKTHNLNRVSVNGKDEYEKIIENMLLMRKMGGDFFVRMTVTANNVSSFYPNVRYFYDLGIRKINIGVDHIGKWTEDALNTLDSQYDLIDEFYLNVVADSDDGIINIHDYKLNIFVADRKPAYCSGGSKGHLVINSSGELYPCGYVVGDEIWKLGSVETDLNRKKFLESVRANVVKKSNCHECDIAFTCSGAKCGFYNYIMTGKLNVNHDLTCNLERLLYKHNLYVIKELYRKNHKRIIKHLNRAAKHNIKLSPIMNDIILEEQLCIL